MNSGERIKELRLSNHMKQSDLAKLADVSRVAIGNYERGTRQPTIDIATRIANALGVSVNDLVGLGTHFDEIIDSKTLSKEVKLIEQIEENYGKGSAELVHFYSILDDQGKEKAYDYINYLSKQQK